MGSVTRGARGAVALLGALALGAQVHCAGEGARPRIQVLCSTLPDEIHPYRSRGVGSRDVLFNVFEPLLHVDAMGRLTPALAESWWNPSPDRYTFRLRRGVTFHDGHPLEAREVAASLERARGRDSLLAGQLAEVEEITASDAGTVTLRTRGSTETLVYALTAVPIARVGAAGRFTGTGPYQVTGFKPSERVELRRVPGHYQRRPYLEEATFVIFRSPAEALSALRADPRTAVMTPPREVIDAVSGDERFRVDAWMGGSLFYLAFDLARSPTPGVDLPANPFRDRRVRRAVRLALDLEALIGESAPAGGIPATQLVPPGVVGFDQSLPPVPRDVGGAKQLLAQAGHPHGFDVVLDTSAPNRGIAEAVGRQLGPAGFGVTVNVLPAERFRSRVESGSSFYLRNWVLGRGSGEALASFLHTRAPEQRLGLRNATGYSNPRVDELLQMARGVTGQRERAELLQNAMRLLMEDLPWVPLFADRTARVRPRDLQFPMRSDTLLVLHEVEPTR